MDLSFLQNVFGEARDTYVGLGRKIWRDLGQVYEDGKNFDPYNVDWHNVNWTAVFMFSVVIGFILIIIIANLLPESEAPGVQEGNTATGDLNGVVRREGDPPIPPPTEIVSLRVYPIKSCRGFEIDGTRLRPSGLTLDRNWMFISKSDRKFLTIRSDPSMTLIDTAVIESTAKPNKGEQLLSISIRNNDKPEEKPQSVAVPAFPTKAWLESNTTLSKVEIWEQETDAWEYGPEINAPFTAFFGKPVALVYKGPTNRLCRVNGSKELYGAETPHHFADVMSLQIASEASLADLNRRLASTTTTQSPNNNQPFEPLTIERFRPNIIVRGRTSHPWEEDTWKRIRITTILPSEEALYKIDLDAVARCARCQVPNVDPDTAGKHPRQPWEELMRFRRVDKGGAAKWKPCFGMLCIPKNGGKVAVGGKVEVLETTGRHLYDTARFSDL
ncbi:MOSC-domain-containing protein [Hortaea werneckii]|nr:MOSC-domain-containing protein [Hortaea werneckii]